MKEIYISMSIVNYGNGTIESRLCQGIDDEELEITRITELKKAYKLLWEIVLAGGNHSVHVNSLDNSIVTHNAYIFLPY